MSQRLIDRMPAPAKSRPVKVIVASISRSGTLSMHAAMQILGFNSYHIQECAGLGPLHLQILTEAVRAQHNRLSGVKRYNKADFDKWMADYDCIVEIPAFMGKDFFEAYAEDPDVKFILTERQPEKWAKSVNNSIAKVAVAAESFPLAILKYFDPTLKALFEMNTLVYNVWSRNTRPGDPENIEELCRTYQDHLGLAKKYIPADRLHIIKLENGVDWNDICPFLNVPIPGQKYPPPNDPEHFRKMADGFLKPKIHAAIFRLSLVTIPILASVGWASWTYAPFAFSLLKQIW